MIDTEMLFLQGNAQILGFDQTKPVQTWYLNLCILQQWLRDTYNVELIVLRYTYSGGIYQGRKYMWAMDHYNEKYNHKLEESSEHWILNERKSQGYDFNTYEEALEQGVDYTLKYLVEQKGEKPLGL